MPTITVKRLSVLPDELVNPELMTRKGRFVNYLKDVYEIRNYTPHSITIIDNPELRSSYEPQKQPVRVPESFEILGEYCGHHIFGVKYDHERTNLPEFESGILNIVSLLVAQYVAKHHPERVDFITVGGVVRDKKGAIIGCRNFTFVD